MRNIYPSKDILNQIVMNVLEVEGYKDAAKKFELESGTKCKNISINSDHLANLDNDVVDKRIEIRKLILKGDIEKAMDAIHNLDSEVSLHIVMF